MPGPAASRNDSFVFLVVFLFLGGCATSELEPGDPSAPSQVTPVEALALADAMTRHAWTPYARNILHGADSNGIRVDTPDASYRPATGRDGWWIPGEVNEGIPYKWGGFDGPDAFDAAIAKGAPAGDVSSPEKRLADNAAVSAQAAGIDCSGFVSRCLKLPAVHDTRKLPTVCDPLDNTLDLRAGDILVVPGRHAMLVAGWARADRSWIYYYETGAIPEWKPALKRSPLRKLLDLGYRPMRYRGMARGPAAGGKEILTRAMRAGAIDEPNPAIGEP